MSREQWETTNGALAELDRFLNEIEFQESQEPKTQKFYQIYDVLRFIKNPEWIVKAIQEVKEICLVDEINMEFYLLSARLPKSAFYGRNLFVHHLIRWIFEQEAKNSHFHEQIGLVVGWAPHFDSDEETAEFILKNYCGNK